jgi:osmotically-inducible protein OsmY
MGTQAEMKLDSRLRQEVEEELRRELGAEASGILVRVTNGVVTLTGFLHSFNESWQAENATRRVAGVTGIVNDLGVRLPLLDRRPDPEIARDAVEALSYELPDVADEVTVSVSSGVITLEGEVRWYFKRVRAERLARRVRGATGVRNEIRIRPVTLPLDLESSVRTELKRNRLTRGAGIEVEIRGTQAILRGTVDTWEAREAAEEAAGHAPGLTNVHNLLTVARR